LRQQLVPLPPRPRPSWTSLAASAGVHAAVALLAAGDDPAVLLVGGFHYFMKYLIKICHHLGRLCALFGVDLMRERNF